MFLSRSQPRPQPNRGRGCPATIASCWVNNDSRLSIHPPPSLAFLQIYWTSRLALPTPSPIPCALLSAFCGFSRPDLIRRDKEDALRRFCRVAIGYLSSPHFDPYPTQPRPPPTPLLRSFPRRSYVVFGPRSRSVEVLQDSVALIKTPTMVYTRRQSRRNAENAQV
jgi:hypothetical protein